MSTVRALSGGFTIYPSSAIRLYPTSQQALNWFSTEASEAEMARIFDEVRPVEFTGEPGDCIFAHSCTLHSAGIQESGNVRKAVIMDLNRSRPRGHLKWRALGVRNPASAFLRACSSHGVAAQRNGGSGASCDMNGVFQLPPEDADVDDPADGTRVVLYPWLHDSLEWVEDTRPPDADMWSDWNLGREPVRGDVVDEPSWWEKYELPMLPSPGQPRGGGGGPAVPISQIATYEGNGRWQAKLRSQ